MQMNAATGVSITQYVIDGTLETLVHETPEPELLLFKSAFGALGGAVGDADALDAHHFRGRLVLRRVESGVRCDQTRCAPQLGSMDFDGRLAAVRLRGLVLARPPVPRSRSTSAAVSRRSATPLSRRRLKAPTRSWTAASPSKSNITRQLCGSSWSPDRVFLTRPPPRDAALFTRFFGAPVESGAPAARIRIEFSAVMLGWRVAGQSAEHRKILAPLLDKALAEAKDDFVSAVKAVPIGAPRSFVPQHTLRKAEGFWIEAVGA